MSTAATATLVVILAAAWAVVDNIADHGVPESWWPWLGTANAVGAVGLLAGLAPLPRPRAGRRWLVAPT